MGRFVYESNVHADFDDRLLLHLQTVIAIKLRRGEAFAFTWRSAPSTNEGRTTVWLNASSTLTFRYFGSRQPSLNKRWLEALMYTANSPAGLHVVHEPENVPEVLTDAFVESTPRAGAF
jgi:hypothetical protein